MEDTRIHATAPVVVRAEGLVLREWRDTDVPAMVAMFDTPDVDRWTPLAHPFDEAAAVAYVARARERRSQGSLQLAITEDGEEPLGEVLLFATDLDATCEVGYMVGPRHRGRGLATRAVKALVAFAAAEGYRVARLSIDVENDVSRRVALRAGFSRGPEPVVRRERKGYVDHLGTWVRTLQGR